MTGWRNIGRKLRVALVGPDRERKWLAERLSGEVEIYDGVAAGIHNLAPATVDAVIVIDGDRIGLDAADVAKRIRKNFVGTVLVVREARAQILEEQLGLILGDELEAAKLDDTVSVAAQTTWALANLSQRWASPEASASTASVPTASAPTEPVPTERVRPVRRPSARKPPPLDEVPTEETTREVLSEAVLAAVDVTGFDDDDKTPVLFESATRPFAPSSDMLAAVAAEGDGLDASAETLRAKPGPRPSVAAPRRASSGSERRPSGSGVVADAGAGHPSWKKPPQRRPSASVLFTGSIILPAEEGAQPISIVDPERPSTPPRPTLAERSIAPDDRLYPAEAPPRPEVRPVSMLPAVNPTSSRRTLWLTFVGLGVLAVWLLIEVLS
ncbi:MAG: hypothetical protein RMA76_09255 [Deltaproteobacteria bacterium]